jgi:hypothetical protein
MAALIAARASENKEMPQRWIRAAAGGIHLPWQGSF